MPAHAPELVACLECDRLHRRTAVPLGHAARCVRCGAVLYVGKKSTVEHSVALACAALVLWLGVLRDPFMIFELTGQRQTCTLTTGVWQLWEDGRYGVSLSVLLTAVLVPLARLVSLLWLQVPLLFGRVPPQRRRASRLYAWLASWGMLDVMLLAALVTFVKFADYGSLAVGHGFMAFVVLVFVSSAAHATFDPERIWVRPEPAA